MHAIFLKRMLSIFLSLSLCFTEHTTCALALPHTHEHILFFRFFFFIRIRFKSTKPVSFDSSSLFLSLFSSMLFSRSCSVFFNWRFDRSYALRESFNEKKVKWNRITLSIWLEWCVQAHFFSLSLSPFIFPLYFNLSIEATRSDIKFPWRNENNV